MTKNINRLITAVTWEALDTNLVAHSLAKLVKDLRDPNIRIVILATDLFQVNWETDNKRLLDLTKLGPIEIKTFSNLHEKWAEESYFEKFSQRQVDEQLLAIQSNIFPNISTRVLLSTDLYFSHYERQPFFRKFTEIEKKVIFIDTVKEIQCFFKGFRPNLNVLLGTNYLAKNVAAHYTAEQKIPNLTIVRSRHKNFWHGIDGYPVSTLQNDPSLIKEQDCRKRATTKIEPYVGTTSIYAEKLKLNKFRLAIKDLKSFLIFLVTRTFRNISVKKISRFRDATEPRRYIYELLKLYRRVVYLCRGLPVSTSSDVSCPYFFYPLHARPEQGTLTLGRGTDDEEAIAYVHKRLPLGAKLLIKENPMMIEVRRASFYHNLLKQYDDIAFCSPEMETDRLIENALGVIGISGTALLEAKILGKPAYALGFPEFHQILDGQGFDNLEKFMVNCVRGQHSSDISLSTYLSQILENGAEIKVTNDILKSENDLSNQSIQMASIIKNFISAKELF